MPNYPEAVRAIAEEIINHKGYYGHPIVHCEKSIADGTRELVDALRPFTEGLAWVSDANVETARAMLSKWSAPSEEEK